jgi:hypothetical protein
MKRSDEKRNQFAFAFIALCLITTVFFSGCIDESIDEDQSVQTEQWKFAVFGDTRGNNENLSGKSGINDTIVEAIAEAIVNDSCDLVLVPGDMINGWWANGSTSYSDQFTNWKNAMDPIYSANITVYTVRGNHEDGPSMYPPEPPYSPDPDPDLKAAYIEAFSGDNPDNGPVGEKDLTYTFTYKNAFFVGLDEYVTPYKVNLTWLEHQFAENSQPHIFVFGHDPAFQVIHPDCLAFYPADRDAFWNSIGDAGGHTYFCGHDHFYNRAYIQDKSGNKIYQLLVGSCGAPTKNWNGSYNDPDVVAEYYSNESGYTLVTIDSETATFEWKSWNGTGDPNWITRDKFTINVA